MSDEESRNPEKINEYQKPWIMHEKIIDILEGWFQENKYETSYGDARIGPDLIAIKEGERIATEVKVFAKTRFSNLMRSTDLVIGNFMIIQSGAKEKYTEFYLAINIEIFNNLEANQCQSFLDRLEKFGAGLLVVDVERINVMKELEPTSKPIEELINERIPELKEITQENKEKIINIIYDSASERKDEIIENQREEITSKDETINRYRQEMSSQLRGDFLLGGVAAGGLLLFVEALISYYNPADPGYHSGFTLIQVFISCLLLVGAIGFWLYLGHREYN